MDSERKEFEAWLDSFDPRNPNRPSTTLERNEAWRAWQARAEQSRAECEALRAKAARYDWLTRREGDVSVLAFKNDYCNPFTTIRASGSLNVDGHFDCVHEAIDAAMGKEKA
jgi:hypothetical protein